MLNLPVPAVTIGLLLASNIFMTFAWYGHLKNLSARPWIVAALVSWGIAFFEYLLQVPANRIGHVDHGGPFTLSQLKIIQEAITLTVFLLFAILVAKETPRPRDLIAFALVLAAVWVAVSGRR